MASSLAGGECGGSASKTVIQTPSVFGKPIKPLKLTQPCRDKIQIFYNTRTCIRGNC